MDPSLSYITCRTVTYCVPNIPVATADDMEVDEPGHTTGDPVEVDPLSTSQLRANADDDDMEEDDMVCIALICLDIQLTSYLLQLFGPYKIAQKPGQGWLRDCKLDEHTGLPLFTLPLP